LGSFWGFLVGLVFVMPIDGVLLGAAAGPPGGKLSDCSINDGFMKVSARSFEPGHAALRTSPNESKEKALGDTSRPILPTDAGNSSAYPATNNRSLLP